MSGFRDRLPEEIVTDRLVLTTPTMAHVPDMALLANNERIYQVLTRMPHPYHESHGQDFVENVARGQEEFAWSIMLSERYIGTIGLNVLPGQLPALGYWLGEPYWGNGYATEASMAVVAAAKVAGAPALRSRALLSNDASRKVLNKAGFVELGEEDDGVGRRMVSMRLEFGL